MTEPRTPRLARVTRTQAGALTAVARHGADRLFTPISDRGAGMPAGPWRLRMQSFPGQPGVDDVYRSVLADWNGATLSLRLPARVCDDWLAIRLPDLQIGELPASFIDAAWEAMIADVLAVLGIEELCAGMRISQDGMAGPNVPCPYVWRLSIQAVDTGRTIAAELAVDELGLSRLAQLLSRLPAPHADPSGDAGDRLACPDALPMVLAAKVGQTTLDMTALRSLESGDVVLFDRCLATPDGGVWLTTRDGQGLHVRACANGASRYVVTQEWSLLMDDLPETLAGGSDPPFGPRRDAQVDAPFGSLDEGGYAGKLDPHDDEYAGQMGAPPDSIAEGEYPWSYPEADEPRASPPSLRDPSPVSPATSRDGGLDIDRIPVRLDFDLGEQVLTLGELQRLRPGEFFDLQRRLDAGPVHIRANGTLVGTAELVDIEGRVGARVLTLTLDRLSCR